MMPPLEDENYTFVAMTSNARVEDGDRWVIEDRSALLEIKPADDISDRYLREVCFKLQQAIGAHHQVAGEPTPPWSAWQIHRWPERKGSEDRQRYIAWHGTMVAGYLNLRPGYPSINQTDKKVLYVEHMAASPGNLRTGLWCRRLKHVGEALLAYAVLQSFRQDTGGLLGLHAAEEGAAGYYKDLNNGRGGKLFFPEVKGVAGAPPRADDARSKTYFETTPEGAAELLEDYCNV